MKVRDAWKAPRRSAPASAIERPHYIPTEAKCRAAMRQLLLNHERVNFMLGVRALATGGMGRLLLDLKDSIARKLGCEVSDLRLDHDPALVLREYDPKTKKFTPDAADPYFLIYREKHDHHLKTNVRGEHGARSDTAERVHRRRLDENRGLRPRKPKKEIQSRPFTSSGKMLRANRKWFGARAWPTRKMQSRPWQ